MAVQLLRPRVSNAGGMSLIPSWGTKNPQAMWYGQTKTNQRPIIQGGWRGGETRSLIRSEAFMSKIN